MPPQVRGQGPSHALPGLELLWREVGELVHSHEPREAFPGDEDPVVLLDHCQVCLEGCKTLMPLGTVGLPESCCVVLEGVALVAVHDRQRLTQRRAQQCEAN